MAAIVKKILAASLEPMQVDVVEENQNVEEEQHYVVENATIDLDHYASQYVGLARLNRLLFIAEHCNSLKIEALRMALNYTMKTTFNTSLYQIIHHKLVQATSGVRTGSNSSSNNLPDLAPVNSIDTQWVEVTSKKAALKLEKLDTDLKNYKSNSIKESIRYTVRCSSFECHHGLSCEMKLKLMHTSNIIVLFIILKVSVYLQNWSHVQSYVNKAEATPDTSDSSKDANQTISSRLKCAAGLADLATRKYKSAAKYFLQVNFDLCEFPELLSPSNIATYGALCALATFDRKELQVNVISSSSFKQFLELEPQLRDIMSKFYESKYASCLTLLDELKDNLLLDMYVAPHVNTLYTQIRNRALCQYFSPYLSADMRKMAEAFNTTVGALEDELMQLILDGQIKARIDSHNKILYAKDADQRSTTFEKALIVGKEYQRRTKVCEIVSHNKFILDFIYVFQSPPREGLQGGEMSIAPASASSMVRN
uniref:PCI domain-containing protein n=1 Tax=Biomphalaria glabrata TaxID=6526 RepID=A0A2C9JNF0_BIOGL